MCHGAARVVSGSYHKSIYCLWRFPSDSEPSKRSERSDFLVIHASVMFPGKTIRRLYVFTSKLSKQNTVSVVGDSKTARILY